MATYTINPAGGADFTGLIACLSDGTVQADTGDVAIIYQDSATADNTGGAASTSALTASSLLIQGSTPTSRSWDTTKGRIIADVTAGALINVAAEIPTILRNLQLENTGAVASNPRCIIKSSTTTSLIIDRCIMNISTAGTPGTYCRPISIDGDGEIIIARSVLMGTFKYAVFNAVTSIDNAILYQNTVVGTAQDYGYYWRPLAGTNNRIINNIAQGAITGDYSLANVDYSAGNLSSDTSSPQAALQSKVLSFIGGGDYGLAATDTSAFDVGDDLSGDTYYPLSVDRISNARSATPDLGAYEYVSAGGGILIPIATNHVIKQLNG